MPETVARSSLRDFLTIVRPYVDQVRLEPVSRTNANDTRVRAAETAVRESLELTDGGWPVDALFRLRKSLEVAVHLGEVDVRAWQLLYVIFESLCGADRCRPIRERNAWATALEQGVEAINLHWFRHNMIGGSREQVVADAIRQLRTKGFRAAIDGHGSRLPASEYLRLCRRIEKKIEKVGGLHVANALLDLMQRVGRVRDGSLIHARTPQMVATRRTEAGTPWHFLYSLAVKHAGRATRTRAVEATLQSMEECARLLAAVIDVEPHSSYENMSIAGSAIAEVLNDTLVYDEMFAFPQWQPVAADTLVPAWFTALNDEGCTFPVGSAEQWTNFGTSLLKRSQPSSLAPIRDRDFVSPGLPLVQARRLFLACCARSADLNRKYKTPSGTSTRTASYFPILPAANAITVAQPKGIAARALCERVYSLMREAGVPDLENRMGRALERLTAHVLQNGGHVLTVQGGFYANPDGGADLEIDLAVETDERVWLFECKKKPLTNASRRGETLAALRDLNASFLRSVQQLARHEAALRSKGTLTFRDGSSLFLGERSVEKFCISLFDHGSLQHRDMTMALLELFIGRQLSIDDPAARPLQETINRRLLSIDGSLRQILDSQEGDDGRLIFAFAMSTWWLSIDQLQYAISGDGDLWSGISRIRHLTRRSGDMIYDMLTTKRLNEVGEALFDVNKRMDNRSLL